jgi:hypothetical protein
LVYFELKLMSEESGQRTASVNERFIKMSESDHLNVYLQKLHDNYLPNFIKVVFILLFIIFTLILGGLISYTLILDGSIQISAQYSWLSLFLPFLIITGVLSIFCCVSSCCWIYLPAPIRYYYRKREENAQSAIYNAPIFYSHFSFYHLLVISWYQFSWIPVLLLVIGLKTVWLPASVYWSILIIPVAAVAAFSNVYAYFESFMTLKDSPRILKNTYICLFINVLQTLMLISILFSIFMIFAKIDQLMSFSWMVTFIPCSFSMFVVLLFVVVFVLASLFYLQDENTYTECDCSVASFCVYFVMFSLSFFGGLIWSLFWILLALKLDLILLDLDYIVISIPLIALCVAIPVTVMFLLAFWLYDKSMFSWLRAN